MEAREKFQGSLISEIRLRHALPEDRSFILSSWCRSYQGIKGVPRLVYNRYQAEVVGALLSRAHILVAAPKHDAHQILGYIVAQDIMEPGFVVHYAYVKQTYRKLGIARALLEHCQMLWSSKKIHATHMTPVIKEIQGGRSSMDIVYNPFLLMKGVSLGYGDITHQVC